MKRPMVSFLRRVAANSFLRQSLAASVLVALAQIMASSAYAQSGETGLGVPKPWEIGMQTAYGPLKERIDSLHDLIMVIITAIVVFVAALLGWCAYRFSAKRNPVPSRTSHHTWLEIAWTLIPALILAVIAIPSFRLVYYEDRTHNPDVTLKVTAHQWYWEYGYPDNGIDSIESRVIQDGDLKPDQIRLLSVDNQVVVPYGKNVRVLVTSADVIHSFFIPSLGVQRYAIPGRTIETWFRVDKPGVYYGECNQICGAFHSQMPIAVKAVSPEEFQKWAESQKTKKTSLNNTPAGQTIPRQFAEGGR